MTNHKMQFVKTSNGNIAKYKKYIVPMGSAIWDAVEQENSDKRFENAVKRASGFTGRNFSINGNCYGRNIGNRTLSVYGTFEILN